MKIKIVIQHLLENIILNNAGAYTKKERKKKKKISSVTIFVNPEIYNLQNCWPSLLFNNICQITNK